MIPAWCSHRADNPLLEILHLVVSVMQKLRPPPNPRLFLFLLLLRGASVPLTTLMLGRVLLLGLQVYKPSHYILCLAEIPAWVSSSGPLCVSPGWSASPKCRQPNACAAGNPGDGCAQETAFCSGVGEGGRGERLAVSPVGPALPGPAVHPLKRTTVVCVQLVLAYFISWKKRSPTGFYPPSLQRKQAGNFCFNLRVSPER